MEGSMVWNCSTFSVLHSGLHSGSQGYDFISGWNPILCTRPVLEYSLSPFLLYLECSRKARFIHLALELLSTTEHTKSSHSWIFKKQGIQ